MESLEARQMLSISPMEPAAIYPQYEEVYVQPSMAVDYNFMETADVQFTAIAPAAISSGWGTITSKTTDGYQSGVFRC